MGFLDKILKGFLGNKNEKDVKELRKVVDEILAAEKEIEKLSIDEIREKTASFKAKIKEATQKQTDEINALKRQAEESENVSEKDEIFNKIDQLNQDKYKIEESVLNEILPQAYALVKETAKRFYKEDQIIVKATPFDRQLSGKKDYVSLKGDDQAVWQTSWNAAGKAVEWDMVHYDVQLIGGTVLHQGKIAEMQTGEGKTLVATLPLYLNALTGRGVHVITVNDYLARRDASWIGPLMEFHGLSVDCIDNHQPNSEGRKEAYKKDIIYGTNNEFGFDYLRDNMATSTDKLVQQELNYAVIDEVDSVLIDDARTPLIISGPVPQGDRQEFDQLKPNIETLVNAQRKELSQSLNDAKKIWKNGDKKAAGFELMKVYRGLPKYKPLIKFLSEEGVRTQLQKTEAYYMQDNNREMHKIDEHLYFTIDEKNNQINLTDKGIDKLTQGSSDPSFFILPDITTEIAKIEQKNLSQEEEHEEKEKFFRDFAIKSERIHTMNQLLKAYTLFEKDVEYVVMEDQVKIVDEQTGRIMDGRRYSDGLHQAIEAKENVKIEAATQTFATITLQNYFRMYNKLSGMTGTAETEAGEFWEIYKLDVIAIPTNRPIARDDRQDLIYKTNREKYNAVIEEILHLSQEQKRPVLVGTTSVEVSEFLSRSLQMRKIPHNVLNAKLHKQEADVVAQAGQPGKITIATNMAGRGTDIKLIEEVKDAGGLAIIGTERHDSRRVDRQLRGRSGRQGDPGSSQFFVSLEDSLMRLFGSEKISKLMDRMGHKEGDVLQHSMVSKSIERAQKKVEENNFGIRKRLLEYDDVMNRQREVIYTRRRNALNGERLDTDIANMIYDTSAAIVGEHKASGKFQDFKLDLINYFTMESPVSEEEFKTTQTNKLVEAVFQAAMEDYKIKFKTTAEKAYPVIANVFENNGQNFKRIQIPFSDGNKNLMVITDLEEAYHSHGKKLMKDFEKNITLALIDEHWKEHLRDMDDLRRSVQNVTYEQKDPLVVYKEESFYMFRNMIDTINREVVSFLFKGELPAPDPEQIQRTRKEREEKMQMSRGEDMNEAQQQQQQVADRQQQPEPQQIQPRYVMKIGRNEVVRIRNVQTNQVEEVKYKKAEPLIDSGEWVMDNE